MVRTTLAIAAALSACSLAACGSSSSGTSTSTTTPNISTPAPTTSTPPPAAAATVDVSGTWTGQYTGVYSGTFTLAWQQTGSDVNGSIKLSSPASTYGIHGTLSGSAIQFGAVGTVAYTGTVSGNTMSGSYQSLKGGGGSWSATKS